MERKTKILFESELSKGSTKLYLWHLRQYLSWLKTLHKPSRKPLDNIKDYIYHRTVEAKSLWSKGTANVAFYALKKYYEKQKGILIDKRFFSNTGEETGYKPRILTRNEVQRIWKESSKLGVERIMMNVAWDGALRSGELVTLKGQNFLKSGDLHVKILKTKKSWKTVPLYPETFALVRPLITTKGRYVFRHKHGYKGQYSDIKRYGSEEWSRWFRKWSVGVFGKDGVRFHDFSRHTRLTHYAEDTRSFMAVLQLSGHQNPSVCRTYFENAKIHVPELDVIKKQRWNF